MKWKPRQMNKKGDIQDIILIIVFIVGFAMASIVAFKFFGEFNDKIQEGDVFSADAKTEMNETYTRMPLIFDGALLVVFVLFTLVMLISAWYMETHPAIFILAFILVAIMLIVAGVLSQAFQEFTQADTMINATVEFPITNFIVNNLAIMGLAIGVSLIIVLFAKHKVGGG